jgi:class 3 adenylate cyclase
LRHKGGEVARLSARFALVASLAVALAPDSAPTATTVDVAPAFQRLAAGVLLFEDKSAKLTITDVRSPAISAQFAGRSASSFGYTSSAVWIRMTLVNDADTALERWLTLDHPLVDRIELYADDAPVRVSGRDLPRETRELGGRAFAFRLLIPARASLAVYIRATSEYSLQLPMALGDLREINARDQRTGLFAAFFYGILLALAIYNTFLFLYVRDRTHLYYVLQVVCGAAWVTTLDGTLGAVTNAVVPHNVSAFFGLPHMGFGLLFARRFLGLPASHPKFDRLYVTVTACVVALILGFWVFASFRLLSIIVLPLQLLSALLVLCIAVWRFNDGVASARYIALGWSGLLVFGGIASAAVRGLIDLDARVLPHVGYATEAICLSLALADDARRRSQHIARLLTASGRFVPYELLALLGKRELPEVEKGDQIERTMTIFFLDVRGFTSRLERLSPEKAIAFVNDLFARVETPIERHRGVIDKFIGDGVMAIFERADDAAQAAVACLGALDPSMSVGIGLHTGPVMLGTVGGTRRLSCTVIGDSVNLAARIEGMTKTFGASILLSDATKRALSGSIELRALGQVTAKGKTEPVGLYEALDGLSATERARKLETRAAFEAGVSAFTSGDLQGARRAFAAQPDDKAAAIFLEQCDNPGPVSGVVTLDTK